MSAFLLGLGFKANMGSKTRKLVLLKLIDACDDDGSHIFPAVATVARAAECSTRQVQREIGLMTKCGLLTLVRKGGMRPGDTNEYCLNLDMLHAICKCGWVKYFGTSAGDDDVMGDMMSPIPIDQSERMGDMVSPMASPSEADPKNSPSRPVMGDIDVMDDTGVMGDILGLMGDTSCHPTPPLDPYIPHYVRNASPHASKANPIRDELLAVLDEERADAVIDHRKAIKHPLTRHGAKLLARKFAQSPDPGMAADAMVSNGWRGFELEWLANRQSGSAYSAGQRPPIQRNPARPASAVDQLRSALQKYEEIKHETGDGKGSFTAVGEFWLGQQHGQSSDAQDHDRDCRRLPNHSGSTRGQQI
jgi:hypothetical protein